MITLMETAKVARSVSIMILIISNIPQAMVRESLPIKCMEAIILGIYLTNGIPGLGRFPINFKSEVDEVSLLKGRKFYYHVVLGLAYKVGSHFSLFSVDLSGVELGSLKKVIIRESLVPLDSPEESP